MRRAFILLALIGLAGCVSGTTTYHSRDGRVSVVCRGGGFWWVPFTTVHEEYSSCREAQRKSGYLDGPPPVRPLHGGYSPSAP